MDRRAELLSGIVRLNDERIDRESPETRNEGKVSGDGSGGGNQPAGEHSPHATPAKGAVPKPQESVWEYAARRKTEISRTVEEILDRDERLKVEREGLREELVKLQEELELLKPLIVIQEKQDELSDRGTGTDGGSPEGVQEDSGHRGNRRRRGVRGGSNRGDTPKEKAPPTSSR